jgi:hypothetical protein
MNVRRVRRVGVLLSVLLSAVGPSLAVEKTTPPVAPAQPLKVAIRSGDIVLKVDDFLGARRRVLDLARRHGAELRDSQTTVNFQGKKAGWLLLAMNVGELDRLTDEIRQTGKLYSEHVQTTDQTTDHETLVRRVALLGQNERELLSFMHGRRDMKGSDILYVQSRLFQSRVEASDAVQEQLALERASQRSEIRVSLFEPQPRRTLDMGNWRAQASYRAKTAAVLLAAKAVTGLYFAVYFAPAWIPLLLILFFAGRLVIRKARASSILRGAGEERTG